MTNRFDITGAPLRATGTHVLRCRHRPGDDNNNKMAFTLRGFAVLIIGIVFGLALALGGTAWHSFTGRADAAPAPAPLLSLIHI